MTEQEATRAAMALCSKREYSSGEILKKLEEWELSAEKASSVIAVLVKDKFVDDTRYAFAFVNDKLKFSRWGKVKISYMLHQKGVSNAICSQVLSEVDEDVYSSILEAELKKKVRTIKASSDYELKGKLVQFALGRGFEYDLAMRVAEQVIKTLAR